MTRLFTDALITPLGTVVAAVDERGALVALDLEEDGPLARRAGVERAPARVAHVRQALEGYFAGTLREFDLELAPGGTEFQERVWAELRRIPYGQTISYGELARRLGNPRAVRAVGRANGRNPIAIVVPCHRVIGSDGSLTGYAGGIERKRFLLELESRVAGGQALISA
jgi:methylated-DNA-[protein]-cysteine S-methyltransferase